MKQTINIIVLFVLVVMTASAQRVNLFQVALDGYNKQTDDVAKAEFFDALPEITQAGAYRLMPTETKAEVLGLASRTSALLALESQATMATVFSKVAVEKRAVVYNKLDASVKTSLVKSLTLAGDLSALEGVATLNTINGRALNDINRNGIVDDTDTAKVGASFELVQGETITTVKSTAEGVFTFANVIPGTYQIRQVTAASETVIGENPREIIVGEGDPLTLTFLSQPCLQSLSGSLVGATTKSGLAEVPMTLTRVGVVESRTVLTDSNGSYTFDNLEVGTYKLTRCDENPESEDAGTTVTIEACTNLELAAATVDEAELTGRISGTVLTATKAAVANMTLTLRKKAVAVRAKAEGDILLKTNTEGRFAAESLAVGNYTLYTCDENPDNVDAGTPITITPCGDVVADRTVEAAAVKGSIAGVARTASKAVVANMAVRVRKVATAVVRREKMDDLVLNTNLEGRFVATELDAGNYKVFSCDEDPDNPDAGTPVTVEPCTEIAADLTVAAESVQGSVSGRILASGVAVKSMVLSLRKVGSAERLTVKSNAEGQFALRNLDAGDYKVFTCDEDPENEDAGEPLTVEPCTDTVKDLDVSEKSEAIQGSISGVMRSGKTVLANMNVRLLNTKTRALVAVKTNAEGRFTAELPAGDYKVLSCDEDPDNEDAGTPVTVEPCTESTTSKDVAASAVKGSLSGTMTLKSTALKGMAIRLQKVGSATLLSVKTDASGRYEVADLEPGEYKVFTCDENPEDGDAGMPITVAPCSAATADKNFESSERIKGSIAGTVRSAKVAVKNMTLQLRNTKTLAVLSAKTNVEGRFQLANLEPGDYKLTTCNENPDDPDAGTPITVEPCTETTADQDAPAEAIKGSLSGKILSAGTAVKSMTVRLQKVGSAELLAVKTDANGLFRATELEAGDYKVFTCDENPDEDDAGTPVTVEPCGETTVPEKDVAATAIKGSVAGTIRSGKSAVANMTVRLKSLATGELRSVKTTAEGRFQIADLDAGEYKIFTCDEHPDGNDNGTPVTIEPCTETTAEKEVAAEAVTAKVAGTVRAGGVAVANKTLRLRKVGSASFVTARTNFEGKYTARNLPAGDYKVYSCDEDPDNDEAGTPVTVDPCGEATADKELEAAAIRGEISGRVLSGGKAVKGMTVTVRSANGAQTLTAKTAADGSYRIADLDAGTYRVTTCDQEPSSLENTVHLEPCQAATAELEVAAEAIKGRVAGTIRSAGAPLAKMSVRLKNVATAQLLSVKTAADGSYAFENLDAGEYVMLTCEEDPENLDAGTPVSVDPCDDKTANKEVEATAVNGSVAGIVRSAGLAVKSMSVRLQKVGSAEIRSVKTTANGRFLVADLEPGNYKALTCDEDPTDPDAGTPVTVEPCGEASTELEAAPEAIKGSITGLVRAEGLAVKSMAVHIRKLATAQLLSVKTAADGRFTAADLDAGDYIVYSCDENPEDPDAGTPVTVAPCSATSADKEVASAAIKGSVSGTIRSVGTPVKNMRVTLSKVATAQALTVKTAADGRFLAENLDAGEYTLHTCDEDPASDPGTPVTVEPCAETVADKEVEAAAVKGSIAGTITADGKQLAAMTVRVRNVGATDMLSVKTAADGRFTAELASGDYIVYTCDEDPDDPAAGTPVTVDPCSEASADIEVAASAVKGTLRGTISAAAMSVANMNVLVRNVGAASFTGVKTAADGSYSLALDAGDYTLYTCDEDPNDPTDGTPVTVDPCQETIADNELSGAPVKGTLSAVVTSGAEVIPYMNVRIRKAAEASLLSLRADRDGKVMTALSGGDYTIYTCDEDADDPDAGTPVSIDACEESAVDVTTDSADVGKGSLSGTVRSTAFDAPALESMQIRIRKVGASAVLAATTDNDGRYVFAALASGDYTLHTCDEDPEDPTSGTPVTVHPCEETVADKTVEAEAVKGSVSGLVLADGVPSQSLSVNIREASSGALASVKTGTDGRYLAELVPGDYTVHTCDEDPTDPTSGTPVTVHACKDVAADKSVSTANIKGTLSGFVRDDDENPINAMTIKVRELATGALLEAATDSDGRYELTDLVAGDYIVHSCDEDAADPESGTPVTIDPCEHAEVDKDVDADDVTATVRGLVKDAADAPIANMVIRVIKTADRSESVVKTGTDGRFSDTVEAGDYTVYTCDEDPANPEDGTPVTVEPCHVSDELELTIANGDTASLSGTLVKYFEVGTPLPEANIRVVRERDDAEFPLVSDTDGRFELTGLEPGEYTVHTCDEDPDDPDDPDAGTPVLVAPCTHTAVDDIGVRPASAITGTVRDERGDALVGRPVQLIKDGVVKSIRSTDTDGKVAFADLNEGTYTLVTFECDHTVEVPVELAPCEHAEDVELTVDETTSIKGVVRESTGPSIAGVTIKLLDAEGTEQDATETAVDGSYTFAGVRPGTWTVVEQDPSELVSTTPNEITVEAHVCDEPIEGIDFEDSMPASLAGNVIWDVNADSVDEDEPRLEGVTIKLFSGDELVDEASTDENGHYAFPVLVPGAYTVVEEDLDGFASTGDVDGPNDNTIDEQLEPGENAIGRDFLDTKLVKVAGTVIFDEDADGIDDDEPHLEGVEVKLIKDGEVLDTANTDENGFYEFTELTPAVYTVMENDPEDFQSTSDVDGDNDNMIDADTSDGTDSEGNDFLDTLVPASLAGTVVYDIDADEVDENEPRIEGVRIKLMQDGEIVDEASTDANGSYEFTDLRPGTYTVMEDDPAGYVSTQDVDGGNDNMIEEVLEAGEHAPGRDFLDTKLVSIKGDVIDDQNADGIDDDDEPHLSGVEVKLIKDGEVVDTTTTDSDGHYSFTGRLPGEYTVMENDPEDYTSTSDVDGGNDNMIDVDVTDGEDAEGKDFLDSKIPASLVGNVIWDLNANSVDDDEPRLEGVAIKLIKDGAIVNETSTDATGHYAFPNLRPGTYTVMENDLDGFESTGDVDGDNDNRITEELEAGEHATGRDFLDTKRLNISGKVIDDTTGNGEEDGGDEPLEGVEVKLLKDGDVVDTTNTDEDGSYEFTGLLPDEYTVMENDPEDYTSTADTDDVNDNMINVDTTDGQDAEGNDFLDTKIPASLAGNVIYDIDADRVDEDEPRIAGVRITLLKDGVVVDETSTDTAGHYEFLKLVPGSYTVLEDDPEGFASTADADGGNDNRIDEDLEPGEHAPRRDFLDTKLVAISGTVVDDEDASATEENSEDGIPGVDVKLLSEDGDVLDVASTDENGDYRFDGLLPDEYSVMENNPAGYESTTADMIDVDLTDGQDEENVDFLDTEPTASLAGNVIYDIDADGVDEDEPRIEGVRIKLLKDGELVDDRSTDETGHYAFEDLIPGSYTVMEEDPDGFTSTADVDGDDPNRIDEFLEPGEHAPGRDFLDTKVASISGTVINDENGDSRGDDEPGIPGVDVKLLDQDGNELDSTTTDDNGDYIFDGLLLDEYRVMENNPQGYESTSPDMIDVDLSDGEDEENVDFLDTKPGASLAGNVIWDVDANGEDDDEPRLEGVRITLMSGGDIVGEATTDENGHYEFLHLEPGIYTVTEEDLEGFASTADVDGNNDNSIEEILDEGEDAVLRDFLDTKLVDVRGSVKDDRNANGNDDDEPGLEGVTVTIRGNDGFEQSTTTDENGDYAFEDLMPDTYVVEEDNPEGYDSTSDDLVRVDTTDGEDSDGIDFLDARPRASLDGNVIHDVDADTIDEGEPRLDGVVIKLLSDGEVVGETTTDRSGYYRFDNLESGTYTVMENDPAGFFSTADVDGDNDNMIVEILEAGEHASGLDFLDTRPGANLSGNVIHDLDADGADNDEPGIEGVRIVLIRDGEQVDETTTDENGYYEFGPLTPGTYVIIEEDHADFVSTADVDGSNDNTIEETLEAEEDARNRDFLDTRPVTITGSVTEEGDEPLEGVTIRIFRDGEPVGRTTTGPDGTFAVADLMPGVYDIVEEDPNGYESTTPNRVTLDLTDGEEMANVSFVDEKPRASISGEVAEDPDADGNDEGGPAIEGVTIKLLDENGDVVAETTSGPDGAYAFDALAPGEYSIMENDPEGMGSTTPNMVAVSLLAGRDATVDFLDARLVRVGDTVWADLDNSGTQDADEAGIEGVTVQLKRANSDAVLAETTTTADGKYLFKDLFPGDYKVVVPEAPADYPVNSSGMSEDETDADDNGDQASAGGMTMSQPFALKAGTEPTDDGDDDNGDMTRDFGFFQFASVSDVVWMDDDNDQNFDSTESPIEGIIVQLIDSDGLQVASVTTGPDGRYTFDRLLPGDYTLRIPELPDMSSANIGDLDGGSSISTPGEAAGSSSFTLGSGASQGGVTFAVRAAVVISSRVIDDLDNDGELESDEPGIAGVRVVLKDPATGDIVAEVMTDESGTYLFDGLVPADYDVQFDLATLPEGARVSSDGVDPITGDAGGTGILMPGAQVAGRSLGFWTPGTVSGTAWFDLSNDGDASNENLMETGIRSVNITLSQNGEVIDSTVTGTDGIYSFAELAPGDYTVTADENTLPRDVDLSTPLIQGFTIQSGGDINASFGLVPTPAAIGLEDFTATVTESGVDVSWTTAHEDNTLGFWVYRELADGTLERLSDQLVLATGGGTYNLSDEGATGGRYRLAEITNDLASERHESEAIAEREAAPVVGETLMVAAEDGTVEVDIAAAANLLAVGFGAAPNVLDLSNPDAPVLLVGDVIETPSGFGAYVAVESGATILVQE